MVVKDSQLTGILYSPNQIIEKLPGIILLSGSDGGIPGNNAIPKSFIEELVNTGFIVFGLAYFGVDNLHLYLENINLEYFELAIQWLQSRPEVKDETISLIGQSRGAELALILGTVINQIKAIVAYAPSSFVTGSFPHPNQPAWIYKNEALQPYLGALSGSNPNISELDDLLQAAQDHLIPAHANTEHDPFIIADLFNARNLKATAAVEIPVEKISCPLLVFSGGQDAIWTSFYYCQSILKRLRAYHSSIIFKHVNYENAGHGLIASYDGPIYHPVGKFWCKLGGTQEGNEEANWVCK